MSPNLDGCANPHMLTSETGGRPHSDRSWQECFAQLSGTVLSIWDASQLDVAGDNAEVMPTFINLADASIKMVIVESGLKMEVKVLTMCRSSLCP